MKIVIKITTLLLFVTVMGTMMSCSKSNESLIVGKWEFAQVSQDGVNWEDRDPWYCTFRSDGILLFGAFSGEYSIYGNTLEIVTGDIFRYEIIALTDSKLILKEEEQWVLPYWKFTRR